MPRVSAAPPNVPSTSRPQTHPFPLNPVHRARSNPEQSTSLIRPLQAAQAGQVALPAAPLAARRVPFLAENGVSHAIRIHPAWTLTVQGLFRRLRRLDFRLLRLLRGLKGGWIYFRKGFGHPEVRRFRNKPTKFINPPLETLTVWGFCQLIRSASPSRPLTSSWRQPSCLRRPLAARLQ